MQIAVYGLWHLGCVTAAGVAEKGFITTGIDPNHETVTALQQGHPPIYEPKLTETIQKAITDKKLSFTNNLTALQNADITWVTFDTPVDDEDRADVDFVIKAIENIFPYLKDDSVVIISSQMPVGTTHRIAQMFQNKYPQKQVHFAYIPENLRLGTAVDYFLAPDRIVVGTDNLTVVMNKLSPLLSAFTENILWMKTTSAEMCKHALNAFLATSITFINELSTICEEVGANAHEVAQGLKSDFRIGKFAYLRPGEAFAGGTLARDIIFLNEIVEKHQLPSGILAAIIQSNHHHSTWNMRTLNKLFNGNLKTKKIALLGLSYKPGTDTLRRSSAVQLATWLTQQGAIVTAFDPALKLLPEQLGVNIDLFPILEDAIRHCDAIVINKPDLAFTSVNNDFLEKSLCKKVILDPGAFLRSKNKIGSEIDYYVVGDKP